MLFFEKKQSIRIDPIKDTPKNSFINICVFNTSIHVINWSSQTIPTKSNFCRTILAYKSFGARDYFLYRAYFPRLRHLPPPPPHLSNFLIPIYAGITPRAAHPRTPRAAHSRTPHSVSLALTGCPPPLAPPAGDSCFPPSASSLVGAVNAIILTVTKPCSPKRRPHRHEAASEPISSFTRSCVVCPSVHHPASSSRLHLASSAATTSSR